MEASQIEDPNKRKLTDLKVAELRSELESRGKDKTGNKAALIERLSNILSEEGHDPDTYLIAIGEPAYKPGPASRKKGTPIKSAQKSSEKDEEDQSADLGDDEGNKPDTDAANIVEDALQLKLDEDLNEYRDTTDGTSKPLEVKYPNRSIQEQDMEEELNHEADDQEENDDGKANEEKRATGKENGKSEENGVRTSPNPGDAPVISPLTVDDMLNIAAARRPTTRTDDVSLIVHLDDTQSELDAELEASVPVDKSAGAKEDPKPESSKSKKSDPLPKKVAKEASKDTKSAKDSKSSSSKKSTEKSSEKRSSNPKDSISKSGGNAPSDRSVWVSGLSQSTRASDLQALFKAHGKVVGAKIITNTKIPGSRFYGLITMESKEQAEQCIKHLHRTELNGRTIAVERTRKPDEKSRSEKDRNKSSKKDEGSSKRRERRRSRSRSPRRSRPIGRPFVSRPFRPPPPNPAIFREIELEHIIRRREREREMREAQRRRMDIMRQREMERKQMEERDKLEREKEKLRIEREKLDREKAELLRLEREKARLEREKIEREKEELRRRLQRTEELSRRPIAAAGVKRPYEDTLWSELDRSAIAPRLAYDSLSSVPRSYPSEFEGRGLSSFDARSGDPLRNARVGVQQDYQSSRRDSARPDRDDRRSGAGNSNFPARSGGDSSRDREPRRPPARDDFVRRGDRFNEKNSAQDSRSNRLPPALNPPMMSVAGQALGGMFQSQSGHSLSALVQSMPSMASAERSYIHSIRRF